MTTEAVLDLIPGGRALIDWFGRVPRFHDAELSEIALFSKAPSTLRIRTWQMTDKVDERGYYVLDEHVVVTVTLETVTDVSLCDFHLPGIISDLDITQADDGFELRWSGSYGVAGTIRCKRASFHLQPEKAE
jgi:Immunity protein 50